MLLVRVPTKYLNIKVAPDIRPDNPAFFICGTGIRPDTVPYMAIRSGYAAKYGIGMQPGMVQVCRQVWYRYAARHFKTEARTFSNWKTQMFQLLAVIHTGELNRLAGYPVR